MQFGKFNYLIWALSRFDVGIYVGIGLTSVVAMALLIAGGAHYSISHNAPCNFVVPVTIVASRFDVNDATQCEYDVKWTVADRAFTGSAAEQCIEQPVGRRLYGCYKQGIPSKLEFVVVKRRDVGGDRTVSPDAAKKGTRDGYILMAVGAC